MNWIHTDTKTIDSAVKKLYSGCQDINLDNLTSMPGKTSRENGKKGGRPKGSYTKPQIGDYVTEAEVKRLIKKAKTMADKGDSNMMKFLLEQVFGKARQSMDLDTTSGGLPFQIVIKPLKSEPSAVKSGGSTKPKNN